MTTDKKRMLVHESIYWVNMNAHTEKAINNCPTCLDFQATHPKDKTMSHKIPRRPGNL